jgi:hypothetical protein
LYTLEYAVVASYQFFNKKILLTRITFMKIDIYSYYDSNKFLERNKKERMLSLRKQKGL